MADEEVAALVVDCGSGLRLLVLVVMHLALCSDVAGPSFLLLSSCTWKSSRFFGASTQCECSRADGAGVAESFTPR